MTTSGTLNDKTLFCDFNDYVVVASSEFVVSAAHIETSNLASEAAFYFFMSFFLSRIRSRTSSSHLCSGVVMI